MHRGGVVGSGVEHDAGLRLELLRLRPGHLRQLHDAVLELALEGALAAVLALLDVELTLDLVRAVLLLLDLLELEAMLHVPELRQIVQPALPGGLGQGGDDGVVLLLRGGEAARHDADGEGQHRAPEHGVTHCSYSLSRDTHHLKGIQIPRKRRCQIKLGDLSDLKTSPL